MGRRKWDPKTKTKIVLEGLSGSPVSELCNEYGIYQNQYYGWRDHFLNEAHSMLESKKGKGREVQRLRREKAGLKQIIGALTVGAKKNRVRTLMRKPSLLVSERNEELLERIRDVKGDHPFWGYRRVWAYLRHVVGGIVVNKKKAYRLMREHNLMVINRTGIL